jgi:hypothetical protein
LLFSQLNWNVLISNGPFLLLETAVIKAIPVPLFRRPAGGHFSGVLTALLRLSVEVCNLFPEKI